MSYEVRNDDGEVLLYARDLNYACIFAQDRLKNFGEDTRVVRLVVEYDTRKAYREILPDGTRRNAPSKEETTERKDR